MIILEEFYPVWVPLCFRKDIGELEIFSNSLCLYGFFPYSWSSYGLYPGRALRTHLEIYSQCLFLHTLHFHLWIFLCRFTTALRCSWRFLHTGDFLYIHMISLPIGIFQSMQRHWWARSTCSLVKTIIICLLWRPGSSRFPTEDLDKAPFGLDLT